MLENKKIDQFLEKVHVKGINHFVDGNDFNGNLVKLKRICFQ